MIPAQKIRASIIINAVRSGQSLLNVSAKPFSTIFLIRTAEHTATDRKNKISKNAPIDNIFKRYPVKGLFFLDSFIFTPFLPPIIVKLYLVFTTIHQKTQNNHII